MDPALPLAFLAAAIPTFFTPGPNNLMLMASSAKFGLGRTVPHMLGICVGFPLMVFVIGLGLGEIFTQYPWLKAVLKYVAAANFLWLAWTLLGLKVGAVKGSERPLNFLEAAMFQWVNPKAWAMAVSFVALVVEPAKAESLRCSCSAWAACCSARSRACSGWCSASSWKNSSNAAAPSGFWGRSSLA